MMKKIVFLLLCLMLSSKAYAALAVGDTIPAASLYGLNVPSTKLATFIGKPMVINFWASWCSPCINEMQSLNHIANSKNFTVIGISTDDDASAAMQLIKKQQLKFNNYIDDNMALEKVFGAYTIPLTILINRNGKIVHIIRGSQQWDSVEYRQLIKEID